MSESQFLMYIADDGKVRVETRLQNETLWLSLNQMAELFGIDKSGISRHLKNIFESGELIREATVANFATVQDEGGRSVARNVEYFNLDAIISVGYRVNSIRGTQFRIWATQKLKEYIVKGFVMDDQRLKNPDQSRYFEELLARIRDIRSSEKVFWKKVLEIYATSIDYDPKAESSQLFFKSMQNKMHWASHGHTAAELIFDRADAEKPNMGITNFPGSRIIKRDVDVAKNYLSQEELNILNRIVTAYLEMAELQALNHTPMTMSNWAERLDMFLTMTGRELLNHAGAISHEQAIEKAHEEYEKFRKRMLEEPTDVEKHFLEAVKKSTQIEQKKKREIE